MVVWFYEILVGNRTVRRSERDFNNKADALVAGVKYFQDNPAIAGETSEQLWVGTIPKTVGGNLTTS
jgi:hypothetical protein